MKSFFTIFSFLLLCFAFSACKKDNPPVEPTTNQTVFMADSKGGLYAFNAQTGATLWKKQIDHPVSEGFVVANELLYMPTLDQTIQAYKVQTGNLKWEVKVDKANLSTNNIVITNGILCTSGVDYLIGLDATTGQKKWELTSLANHGMIYAQNGIIYIRSSAITVIEASTGTVKWRTTLKEFTESPFVIDHESLYVFSYASEPDPSSPFGFPKPYEQVTRLDLKTGNIKWSQRLTGTTRTRLFASSPEHLFIRYRGSFEYRLISLAKQDGRLIWDIPEKPGFGWSSPFYSKSYLYMGAEDGGFYQMHEETGSFKKVFQTNEAFRSSPVIVNGMIYVGGRDHRLYAVEEATGQVKWSVPVKNDLFIVSPVVLDSKGKAYHYAESGMLD